MPSLIATLGVNTTQFTRGLVEAKGHAKEHGHGIASALGENVAERLKEFAGAAAMEEGIRAAVEYADKIGDISHRLGIGVEAAQAWDQALQLNGSSIDAAVPFFEKLATSRQKALQGNAEIAASFAKLGVSITDLKNKRLEDIGTQISGAFGEGDPQALIADLRAVGGKSAGSMVPAFRDGFAEMVQASMEAGRLMSENTIESLKRSGDAFKTFWFEIRNGIGTEVAPALEFLTNRIRNMMDIIGAMGAAAGGFSVGGFKGARQAAEDYQKMMEARDKKEEERKKEGPRKNAVLTEEESQANQTKAVNDYMRTQERIVRLKEELARKTEAAALSEMTAAQKIEYLEQRKIARRELMAAMNEEVGLTEEERLKGESRIEELTAQQHAAGSKYAKDQQEAKRALRPDLNALQKIGGYSAAPEAAMLDVERKSERHLAQINKNIERLARGGSGEGAQAGVQY